MSKFNTVSPKYHKLMSQYNCSLTSIFLLIISVVLSSILSYKLGIVHFSQPNYSIVSQVHNSQSNNRPIVFRKYRAINCEACEVIRALRIIRMLLIYFVRHNLLSDTSHLTNLVSNSILTSTFINTSFMFANTLWSFVTNTLFDIGFQSIPSMNFLLILHCLLISRNF